MLKKRWTYIAIISFAISLVDSIYLTYHHYLINIVRPAESSFCTLSSVIDCDKVALSTFSEILGVPVSTYGIFAYLFMVLFALTSLKQRKNDEDELAIDLSFMFVITLVMGLFTIYEIIASFFFIKTLCMMCSILYVLIVLAVVVSKKGLNRSHKEIFAGFVSFWKKLFERARIGQTASIFIISIAVAWVVDAYTEKSVRIQGDLELNTMLIKDSKERRDALWDRYMELQKEQIDISNTPVKGNLEAKVTVIEFSDYECPHCKTRGRMILDTLKRNPKSFKVYFKHYPLDMDCNPNLQRENHKEACNAARSSICAFKQGKFWQFHDEIFANIKELGESFYNQLVEKYKLNKGQYNVCMKDFAPEAVYADVEHGDEIGVTYTPTIFLNGRNISEIIQDSEDLEYLIGRLKKN